MKVFRSLCHHRLQLLVLLRLAVCVEEEEEEGDANHGGDGGLGLLGSGAGAGDEAEGVPHFLHDHHTLNTSVQLGSTAHLHCLIAGLKDQSVSWYRRKGEEIHLITFGFQTYHNDDRFALNFEQPHDWRLRIRYVQRRDEGSYQCQVSTHPPLIRTIHLQIVEAAIQILDERGVVLREKFYRTGSTIELQCHVTDVATATTLQLAWYHHHHRINYDDSRGGVSVKTELRGTVARSWLRVSNAMREDSGTYHCNVTSLAATSVTIHVVPEEYPAAIQRGSRVATSSWAGLTLLAAAAALASSGLADTFLSTSSPCCPPPHR